MLVEFSFIAVILYLLLAGIIEFGRALYAAQVLQQGVDSAARDLSLLPLPATGTLTGPNGVLTTNATAKQQVFDEGFLVVDLANLPAGQTIADYFAQNAPALNRALLPLMIADTVNGRNLVHYPGQLVASSSTPTGLTVVIPLVQYQGGTDAIIKVIPVVEEISPDPNNDPFNPSMDSSPFNVVAANVPVTQRGIIALRINYPFQAATLVSYQDINGQQTPTTTTDGGALGAYGGDSGLGRLAALGKNVRPFRKVLSAQAIFRRENFQ
jgi:Flp pilus assembly protein TadG